MSEYTGTGNLEVMDEAVNYNGYLARLVRANARPGDRILDFGAGIGTFVAPLHESGFDIAGVEPDLAQLQRIRARGITGFSNLALVPDGQYDYIFSLNVLEHIADDGAILRQLASKLKPGGRLLIYVPAFQTLFSSMDRLVGHYRRYTVPGLTKLVTAANFEIDEARYVDSLGFLASLVFKYVGNRDGRLNRRSILLFDRLIFPLSLALDLVTRRLFGKNALVVAVRR